MAQPVSLLLDGEDPARRGEAAEVARKVNAAISELEHRLVGGEYAVGFFCECGCLGIAPMTMSAYRDGGGAWSEGHEPK